MSAKLFEKEEQRIENAVGELAAAIFSLAQKDYRLAFRLAGSVTSVFSGMRMDMMKSGKIKYEDL